MNKYILLLAAVFFHTICFAQHNFKATFKDSATQTTLAGVSVQLQNGTAAISDSTGNAVLTGIPAGKQTISFSHTGYAEKKVTLFFPLTDSTAIFNFNLISEEEDLDEVVISSTRTSRTIRNTPTRVETIDGEEVDEKVNMRPANISMLLHESTGMQVQQTSATSGNASVRLQGLDGKYTQLLKDGNPSFGNFAAGLSVLEIPPLDLKQMEIIKGPASTLYGAGAIAGVVNFISKTPKEKGEHNFIINRSNVGQTNLGAYSSKKFKKIGYSILGLVNLQDAYDVDKDEFTELPKSNDFTFHPKLFIYPNDKTTITIGNSFSKADRTGGDVKAVEDKPDATHTYFENNKTLRNNSTLDLVKKFNAATTVTIRTSLSYFDREINIPNYSFRGVNKNSFTDASFSKTFKSQTLIAGANFIYDEFKETQLSTLSLRDFKTTTGGLYAQHTWDINDKTKLESGLRTDLVNYGNQLYSRNEVLLLPRISALFVFSNKWSSRIGGGLGYKTPTVFTEQTETFQYRNVLPLNNVRSERSAGATADVNYKTSLGNTLQFNLNQLFFYTNIYRSNVLQQDASGNFLFADTHQPVISKGFETNAKLIYKNDFKLFAGYTFIDAKADYLSGSKYLPLQPKSKLNLALIFEKENNFKTGLEGYFTGKQYLSNGSRTASFSEFGFMAEKTFGKISVFINAENFTDTRQSRYKSVVNGPHTDPVFDEIWTHTEGRTFNGGMKLRL